jgi:D-alanyl-D-alanine carboxypeptidase
MSDRPGRATTLLLLLLLFCAPAGCGAAVVQASARAVGASADARLQAALDTARVRLGAAGAAAGVILADGRTWSGASGNGRPGRSVDVGTAFELGSVTKTYTAALVLRLVAEGRIALEDRLSRWHPGLEGAGRITVEQLLNHTHGLHDPLQEPDFVPAILAEPGRHWTLGDVTSRMRAPHFEPGAGWRYSNTGYHLLGSVVEAVTDSAFGAVLQTRLLAPLGLASTWYGVEDPPNADLAAAYIDPSGSGTAQPVSLLMPWAAFRTSAGPAGAVVATAGDAARWLHALATGAVLGEAEWRRMTAWVDRPDGNRYGLGLLRVEQPGGALLGHRGNSAGYSAAVFHDPATGATVAVLTNAHAVDVTPAVTALLAATGAEREQP